MRPDRRNTTKFLHYQFEAREGDTVVVTLDKQANIRVMDPSNFSRYRQGQRHQYLGGRMPESPARIRLPHSGHWHVAVDMGGFSGSVRASVSLDRTALSV